MEKIPLRKKKHKQIYTLKLVYFNVADNIFKEGWEVQDQCLQDQW